MAMANETDYAKASRAYQNSPEWKEHRDLSILKSDDMLPYLENRLRDTFAAGWGANRNVADEKLRRSNAALRGHNARLKAKLEAFETDGMCEF